MEPFKRYSLVKFRAYIIVNHERNVVLMNCENNVITEFLYEASDIKEYIDPKKLKDIPVECGVYSCLVVYHAFQCNHPQDPEEWDEEVWLEDIKPAIEFDWKLKREHVFEKHENCTTEHCPICEGELKYCTVCHGAEIDLTTECPGIQISDEYRDEVRDKYIDFIDGQWKEING